MIILDEFVDFIKVIRIKMISFYAEMSLDRFGKLVWLVNVELSSTLQAIPLPGLPQADENFNGNTHPRYRQSPAGRLLIC